ncbi:MAG TPA: amidohydrolase [Anaerolineae bacterium]|nr:amidohydrolase [Anaerolineae bacterium]
MPARLILLNGNIVTLDPQQPRAIALVLRGDEILYIGDDATAQTYREHNSETIDLQGKLTLPAFTDAHLHFTGFAQTLEQVNLVGCRSLEQALERVRARALETPPGQLIWGSGWNNADWSNPAYPNCHSLDAAAPQNPVILTRKDGHSVWLNSLALAQANITRETETPTGGVIDRYPDGEPSGILREKAIDLLGGSIGAFGAEIREQTLLRAIQHAHAAGITTVHNIEGANSLRAFQSLHAQNKLTLRVVHSIPDGNLEFARKLGIMRGLGDEWLLVRAVKIFADGSLGSHTAEMREPFLDTPNNCGVAVTDSQTMLQTARDAVDAGIDVWIHAIGDYAITRVLDVFATLRRDGYANAILRVEHVQHLHPSDIPRFRELNVIASMQPIHQPSDMFVADAILGRERAQWTYAFKSLQDAGTTLAFGSDCPVERIDPLLGIHAAVTRQNAAGEPTGGWYPQQKISVTDAVRGFTCGAAIAAGAEQRAGSLTVGKRADVIVLSENLFEIPPREILNTKILYTISGGQVVYTE